MDQKLANNKIVLKRVEEKEEGNNVVSDVTKSIARLPSLCNRQSGAHPSVPPSRSPFTEIAGHSCKKVLAIGAMPAWSTA
eukprot:1139872-Pelagomonas_calceolata.AAC.3